MDCKECVLKGSCAQDKAFCQMEFLSAISDAPYMMQEEPTVIDQYIKTHGYMYDMARERDVAVIKIVLVDGVPVQTPKWMEDILEKLKERDGMNVSQTFVDEWIGEKQHGRDGRTD